MVHFLHTSDWHLGQFFYHHDREYEHQQFLLWLLKQIEEKQPNALLIAGDIFDVINPSSRAQKQLYQFLADAHEVAPHMQTLMIAGNHDSGYRIEQVEPLLAKYNAKAVGIIHKTANKDLNLDHLLVPIYDQKQKIVAWCLALPFLRPAEITGINEQTKDPQNAIAYLHQQLIAEAKARKQPDQALILMSHAHMQGGEISDSERPIIIGNEEALSTALFDDAIDYVALGHLHKPQKVGQAHMRYSGSPIPLSFSEINYKHQILEVKIDPLQSQTTRFQCEVLPIPRSVQLHKITGELDNIFVQLSQLKSEAIEAIDQREYIDIEYTTNAPPPPNLRQLFENALPLNRYRLVRIKRKLTQQNLEQQIENNLLLEPPTPDQLFQQIWQKKGFNPDAQVLNDFLSLVQQAQQQLEDEPKA